MRMNVMDIAVFLLVGLSIFLGFRKGFLKTVTGFLAIVLSLVLACTFQPSVTEYLKETKIYSAVYDHTYTLFDAPEQEGEVHPDSVLGKWNLPRSIAKDVQKNVDAAKDSVGEKVAGIVADIAVNICALLMVFLAARLLLFLVTMLAGVIGKLPLIGWGDGLLGALFGLLRGILIVYIVLALLTFLATLTPDGEIAEAVKQSEFAKVLYHHNFLMDFVYKN